MTLKEIFIAALRRCGGPSTVKEIHQAHKADGGRYSHQAFTTCAWDLAREGQIERTNSRPPYIYTLPHNALARMSRGKAEA